MNKDKLLFVTRYILDAHPNLYLSGSLALSLQGFSLRNEVRDLDFVGNFYPKPNNVYQLDLPIGYEIISQDSTGYTDLWYKYYIRETATQEILNIDVFLQSMPQFLFETKRVIQGIRCTDYDSILAGKLRLLYRHNIRDEKQFMDLIHILVHTDPRSVTDVYNLFKTMPRSAMDINVKEAFDAQGNPAMGSPSFDDLPF